MNDKRFRGSPERLRSEGRVQMIGVEAVVITVLKNIDAQSMCDIGCGSGLFTEAFLQHNLAVSGCDVNPDMIAAAQKYIPGVDVRLSLAEELPFDDNQFDLAFLGLVFHEVDDRKKTLQEAKRVATKGIAILEWPPRITAHGPQNMDHRVKREALYQLCSELNLPEPQSIEFDNVVLYLISLEE